MASNSKFRLADGFQFLQEPGGRLLHVEQPDKPGYSLCGYKMRAAATLPEKRASTLLESCMLCQIVHDRRVARG